MGVQERIHRYRTTGAGADLARVEVLVPMAARGDILALARRLRREHRIAKAGRSVNAERVNDRAKRMIHRIAARRMATDSGIVERARAALSRARASGKHYTYVDEWESLLAREPDDLRRLITENSETMTRLRISSPFALLAGVKDPELRRRIWRKARLGLACRER